MPESFEQSEAIILGARDWWIVAVTLFASAAILALWSYLQRGTWSGWRFLAISLKVAAVVGLAFCLLEPMKRTERPRPGANVMAVVVDNSRSMEMRPPGASTTRAQRILPELQSEAAWQARIAQDFDVRRYAFDERVRAVEDFTSLEFDGNVSSLREAVGTLNDRFASRPVAGALLFTDGLATDDLNSAIRSQQFSFPIYPVVENQPTELRDVRIAEPVVTMSSFELAPASVEATIRAKGVADREIVVRLLDQENQTLDLERIECDSDDFEKKVRFQFLPSEPGFQLVQMRALLADDDRDGEVESTRSEVTLANNSRLLAVDRGGGPYRILYVAGRPNWEFKFLRRALEADVEIQLQALVRIAKEEPKFSFRDRGVDTTNPLMAGFSDDETAEQYDEPVLLRIGVEEDELKAGFPSGKEDLFQYHAIILDDVEAPFFTQQQMMLMRQFVAERGGGLMMLGGQETYLNGGYRDTPLGDVLPVYLRGRDSEVGKDQLVRYRLTREGALEPWLRLRANQSDETKRVDQMPDFLTWNQVADAKPGASVLAELQTENGQAPGLVAQRFGRGRSLSLLVGDFWRWSMRRATLETDDLAQSWRQIGRWLTTDVPRRVTVAVEPPASPTEPFKIVCDLRDATYKPLDNASVALTVTEPDGQQVTATASQVAGQYGQYVAEYWSKSDGGYLCEVDVTGPDGERLQSVATGWSAEPSAAEFGRVEPDYEALQALADASGGELVPIGELASFASNLNSQKVPITEARVEPLWHQPWLALLAIGCLCLEWGIRRWRGLP